MPAEGDLALIKGEPLNTYPSIYYHLEKGLEANPHGPAISVLVVPYQSRNHLQHLIGPLDPTDGTDPGGFVCTHTQLRRAALRVAGGLAAHGIQRGSTLVTLIPNRAEASVLLYTTAICGATFAALDFGALSRPRINELRSFMTRLKPDAVLVANMDDAKSVDSALESIKQTSPKALVVLDGRVDSESSGWMSLAELVSQNEETNAREKELLESARRPDPERISLIAFTSGTSSGSPKGCPRTVGGDSASIDSQANLLQFSKTSRFLLTGAYFRIIAPVLSIAVWCKGGTLVMPSPSFDPKSVMRAVQEHKITHVLFVPFQLHILTRDDSFDPERTGSVEFAIIGADIITKELLRKAKRSFPTANIAAGHGMTEGGAVFHWPYYKTGIEAVPEHGGISALGTAAPGAALRIYDLDDNRVAKRNESGEFQIQSPTTIKHYLENTNQEAFVEDETGRWFRTGDIGLMNGDGIVFLLGRLGDRIKRAGIGITPAALETSLSEYIGAQVSVFGIPHPDLGQEPYVVAESFKAKTEDQVKQFVIDVFGEASTPAGACTLGHLELSQFPTNATGKIMKITLCEAVMKYLGR